MLLFPERGLLAVNCLRSIDYQSLDLQITHLQIGACQRRPQVAQTVKNLPAMKETPRLNPLEDPLEKGVIPSPVFLLGEFHGQKALTGTVHGGSELDTMKQLTHMYIKEKNILNIYKSQYLYYQRSLLGYSPWGRRVGHN